MTVSSSTPLSAYVRTGGHDDNGYGYDLVNDPGTNFANQDAPRWNQTDLESKSDDNTKVKDTAGNIDANDVGNVINIQTGGGFTAGRRNITAFDGTWATLNESCGGTGLSGGAFRVGGAAPSIGSIGQLAIMDGFTLHIQKGTYTFTTTTTNVNGGPFSLTSVSVSMAWFGFNATPGDLDDPANWHDWANMPHFAAGSQTGFTLCNFQPNASRFGIFANLDFDGEDQTGTYGLQTNFDRGIYLDCRARDMAQRGFMNGSAIGCLSSGNGDTGYYNVSYVDLSWAHDNGHNGFELTGRGAVFHRALATDNTQDGFGYVFDASEDLSRFYSCGAYGNGGDGFDLGHKYGNQCMNCVSSNNSGYGYELTNYQGLINCASRSNTSGRKPSAFLGWDVNPVTLTAEWRTSATDYTPNSTAGGGLLLREKGIYMPDHGSSGHPIGPIVRSYPAAVFGKAARMIELAGRL